jgi:hypothetical protein
VTEHARPLDSLGLRDIRRGDVAALAERTELLRARAPFMLPAPFADGHHEERLRHYLRCYGVDLAPREQPRELYDQRMAEVLRGQEQSEAVDLIYVFARLPSEGTLVLPVLRDLRRKRIRVIWIAPSDRLTLPELAGTALGRSAAASARYASAVHEAIGLRATLATARGTALLTKAGARVVASHTQIFKQ